MVPDFLAQYGLAGSTFKNVNHGFNSSFKVDAPDGCSYGLRINTNSKKSSAQVEAEIRLLELIAENRVVDAPVPVRTNLDQAYSKLSLDFLGKDVMAVLNHWIDGEDLGEDMTDTELKQLGAAMAKLHKFAANVPNEIVNAFPRIDQTLFNSPDNLRKGDVRFDPEMQDLIDRCYEISESAFQELSKQSEPLLIHADLHPANVLRTPTGIAVIDFDDVGIGSKLQDLAITFFYLRDMQGKENLVLEGYQSVAELPKMQKELVEALLVSRQLLLLNDLLDSTTAEEIEFTPEYIEISRIRLKHFLTTGRFELIRRLN